MKEGFEVTGRLLTSEGKPALSTWFGGEVGGEHYMGVETSTEDGTFRLSGLPPGPVVLFWNAGRGRTDLGTYTAPADGRELKLPEGALRRE